MLLILPSSFASYALILLCNTILHPKTVHAAKKRTHQLFKVRDTPTISFSDNISILNRDTKRFVRREEIKEEQGREECSKIGDILNTGPAGMWGNDNDNDNSNAMIDRIDIDIDIRFVPFPSSHSFPLQRFSV